MGRTQVLYRSHFRIGRRSLEEFPNTEGREAFRGIEVYIVIEIEFAVKVEVQISPNRFGEIMGPPMDNRSMEGFVRGRLIMSAIE